MLEEGPVLCPFRLLTGHACAGCGLTRSVLAALDGDLQRSLEFHPLTGVLALEIVLVVMGLVWFGRERVMAWIPHVGIVTGALLLGTWALRWHFGLLEIVTAT